MSMKISRILLATDFSKSSQQAQGYASQFAQALGADLHLLTVVVPPLPLPGPNSSWTMPETIVPTLIKQAEEDLAQRATSIPLTSGGKVVCSVESGFPVEAIIDYTKKHQIDFIVMGTHGHR